MALHETVLQDIKESMSLFIEMYNTIEFHLKSKNSTTVFVLAARDYWAIINH